MWIVNCSHKTNIKFFELLKVIKITMALDLYLPFQRLEITIYL